MINWISLLMVIAYGIYFGTSKNIRSYKSKSSLAKCIPMLLGMTSSVTIGLVIAVSIPHLLTLSTILSIALSGIIAFLIGKDLGINGMIEAQSSSFMGAMMGAMLGVMLPSNEVLIMVIATDVIYLISLLVILMLLTKEGEPKVQNRLISKKTIYSAIFLLNIVFISTIGILQSIDKQEVEMNSTPHEHSH